MAKTRSWVLEFAPGQAREIDPLMGWTSSGDMQTQVRMSFASRQAAVDYARRHGIDVDLSERHVRKSNIRPGGYGDNFATARRTVWTH